MPRPRRNRSGAMVSQPRQNGRKRRGAARRGVATALGPGQIRTNIIKRHKFRFLASGAFNGTITSSQMLGAAGSICTVANTTLSMKNYSMKVQSVEIWTPPASQGAGATCSVEWIGSNNSPNEEVSDTSVSTAKPAHLVSRPPANAIAGFWFVAATNTSIMKFVVPSGSIIDLVLDLIEFDDESPVTRAVATATLGATYYLALDHSTSDVLVPVSLQTTV